MSQTKFVARVSDAGNLEVCRHVDGQPAEDWHEPHTVEEIVQLLPRFTQLAVQDSLASDAGTLKMIETALALLPGAIRATTADGAHDGGFTQIGADDGDDRAFDERMAVARASSPHADRRGPQWIPLLREGGGAIAFDQIAATHYTGLVLYFDITDALPKVRRFVDGRPMGEWRGPSVEECAQVTPLVTPTTNVKNAVALFKLNADGEATLHGFAVGFDDEDSTLSEVHYLRERIKMACFDTLVAGGRGLLDDRQQQYTLFSSPNVGNEKMCSLYMGGCFGSDQTASIDNLRIEIDVGVQPARVGGQEVLAGELEAARQRAIARVKAGTYLELVVGTKPFGLGPWEAADGAAAFAGGAASYVVDAGAKIGRSVQIAVRQNFAVRVMLTPEAKAILAAPGALFRVWIEGQLTRDVQ